MIPSITCFALMRESSVHQHAAQFFLRHAGLERQQRSDLRVAILLHDKAELVPVEERLHAVVERETANAHEVGLDPARFQNIQRLAHRRIAAADGDHAELRALSPLDHRRRHELRRRLVFLQQPVEHLLILVGSLGITAKLVVPRAAREKSALRIHARQRARRNVILILRRIAEKLRHLLELAPRPARARDPAGTHRPRSAAAPPNRSCRYPDPKA